MLIEFKVANYKSIKEEQTFSMVASSGKELIDSNTFEVEGLKNRYLPSAAIYGANASGKTNLLLALLSMRKTVLQSHLEKNVGDNIEVIPFKLNPDTRNQPCEFEVVFVADGVRYQYGFSATNRQIVSEWLFAFPEGRPQLWFERGMNSQGKYKWKFGNFLRGQREIWRQSTRDNSLYLSTAIQLNSDQLKPVYYWFKDSLRLSIGINSSLSDEPPMTSVLKLVKESGEEARSIEFLKKADLGIEGFSIEKKTLSSKDFEDFPATLPESFKVAVKDLLKDEDLYDAKTFHTDSEGKQIGFDLFEEESRGTVNAFLLAPIVLKSLNQGIVLVVDELDNSLHPSLVKFIVGLFNNRKANTGDGQLIFTTHETGILNQNILRRDQIWFCEKNENQATQVFSLQDFKPRKGVTNLELAYRSGSYGALPYIRED